MKISISLAMAIFLIIPIYAEAGLVVTDADTGWAKEVLRQIDTPPPLEDTGLPPVTLAILDFINRSEDPQLDPIEKGLAIMLETDLAALNAVNVVERTKVLALSKQMLAAAPEGDITQLVTKVGRLVGAHYVSWGTVNKGQVAQIKIDPRLAKVSRDIILEQPAVIGELNDINKIHKELLFDIVKILEIELTPEEKAALEKPISTDTAALMTFFAGVEASDRGDYQTAANRYAEALVQDPELELARRAIEELEILGLPQKGATDQAAAGATGAADDTDPKKEKSSSSAIAIGAGVALAAGGAILIGSAASGGGGSGGGGGGGETPPDPEPEDTEDPLVTRTTPRPGQTIMCASGNLEFHFTESMNTTYEDVAVDQVGWNITSERWADNDTTLIVDWDNSADPDYCGDSPPEQVTYSLLGFTDKAGNSLQEETQFTYNVGVN